jgi:hypothetical protein
MAGRYDMTYSSSMGSNPTRRFFEDAVFERK